MEEGFEYFIVVYLTFNDFYYILVKEYCIAG